MARILITGIAGFLGRHVAAHAAAEGHDVSGFDVVASPVRPSEVVDLADETAVRGALERFKPDAVIHLAGMLRSPDAGSLYRVHVIGTATLLDAIAAIGFRPRVLVASSSAVYGDPGTAKPIVEPSDLRPLTHYAASKAAQEVVALRFHHAGVLPIAVVRVFNVTGPGQPATLAASAFARQIALAERSSADAIRVGSVDAIRDFVDVRDVASAYVALASHAASGVAYNVCSGIGVPVSRCLEHLVARARKPIRVDCEESLTQPNDVRIQIGDATRLRRAVGWVPRITLDQSLGDLLDDWRRQTQMDTT